MKLRDLFKTHKTEKITAIAFLVIIFGMLWGLLFTEHNVRDDFLEDYRTTILPGTPLIERVAGAIDSLEKTIDNDTYKREEYIDFYGRVQKLLGKRIIVDIGYGELYKTKYGQIAYAVPRQDVSEELENIFQLKEELDKLNIPLLYIQAPFKLPAHEQQLPEHLKDHANENADRFLNGLDAAGIDYFDLRENYWSGEMNQNQLFFNTDHHWTINGAFSSYAEIAEILNTEYGFHIDKKYTDLNNFNQKVFREYYLGSMGRRVGESYGGTDDFTLITPKFDTSYTVYEREYGAEKVFEGDFRKAVLTNSYLEEGTPPETNRYAVYHGDNAELQFVNHNVRGGRLLMLKDSFGLPVYSFLSTGLHEVRALDVRLFQDSVSEYAEEHRPDLVIILYNADCFGSNMFNFKGK
ncbi:MAG: hypothetical protein PHC91_08145 [Eubacteriales bacterium]|nr:hypothetical protein [Eubacteriales bacterium]